MTMTVGKLKNLLNEILETLEEHEDNKEIKLQSNTYFTRGNNYVLETPKGFLGLDDLEKTLNDEDEEGEDE